jgi:hypothetical protein
MPTEITLSVHRLELNSEIVRIYAGALVQVYESGTSTLTWEGNVNNAGYVDIPDLATGKYDVKVDGNLVQVLNHVLAVESKDKAIAFYYEGQITADIEGATEIAMPVHFDVAGTIEQVKYVFRRKTGATIDVVVHVLQGVEGVSTLTMASDSVWNHQVTVVGGGGDRYYVPHVDNAPAITIAADDILQIAVDYNVGSVYGLYVELLFRPTI